ncbi:hypothetical protein BN1044_00838 [Hafnia alvei]|uniref:Uncharacterized protein n=2 Tax=Hafnia alvei TaxID=569 RepID=A0A1C6YWZ6_HAFAL|nr:hypothetical protein BN1044_00838 [Hafnia alvei]
MLTRPKDGVNMEKKEFLSLMKFPDEWTELDMYPDELFTGQLKLYKSDNDSDGSEHYRNGAFHWWIKINPSNLFLLNLVKLSFLDPDQLMAEDIRSYIIKQINYDEKVEGMMKEMYIQNLKFIANAREKS